MSEERRVVVPPTWATAKLGDVAHIEMGQSPSSDTYNEESVGLPFFQGKAEFGAVHPTVRKWCTAPTKVVNAGDILLSIRAPVGPTNITQHQACIGRGLAGLRASEDLDQQYLFYFLRHLQPWLSEQGTGSTFAAINGDFVRAIEVPLAPKPEQVRIVEKLEELLSDLDAGVAELKAAQRKLAQYRQSLLKAAVEGALTADWHAAHGTPQEAGAELLQRILAERRARWEQKQLAKFAEQGKTPPKDWQAKYPEPVAPNPTDLPLLPADWTWASVDQLSFVVRGASPRPAGDPRYFGGDIPWITVGSLTADEGMYLERVDQFVTPLGKDASRYIEPDTLLLTNSGATLGVPKITRIGGCINDGSVALLDIDGPLKTYLYWFLRTQTKRLRALNQGAAQPNLNTDIVKQIRVPLCPRGEMVFINDLLEKLVESTFVQAENVELGLKQAVAQRKNLFKAAFSGQLVQQDSNDEPASELLARIRAERASNDGSVPRRRRKTA